VRAWVVDEPGPIAGSPLRFTELPDPEPGAGEVRVRVRTCGVCRTDLHVTEGDLPKRRSRLVPGHEVVGVVDRRGPGAGRFELGDRVGIAWLRSTCGRCRSCRRGSENLCADPAFTGWTHDGGYAELAVVPEAYAYRVPEHLDDEAAAPLLCAGIIGYRALVRSGFAPGDRLGVWGFGGSAHLTVQLALAMGAELYVVTRGEVGREHARRLGATWVGAPGERPPRRLDAAISFAPVGEVVPDALASLAPGGVLALAGIHVSAIPSLDYARHLFDEREIRSVTANTRADGETFLLLAERLAVTSTTVPYRFDAADQALLDLADGRFAGAAVLHVAGSGRTTAAGSTPAEPDPWVTPPGSAPR
jgi:alcohol dehydrogenase, propanol-preferring